jgi:hypothetical protein
MDCRKALFMREERADDIPKLLEFFQSCKSVNEYFYWDALIDGKTGAIKTYSGVMQVSALSAGILVMS